MVVYLITNRINGKRYVGLTTGTLEKRWKSHCACARWGTKMLIARAIRKYGPDAFLIEQIGTSSSVEGLKQMETDCIKSYCTLSPKGYNLTTGGEHYALVEDVKRRIGDAQKGEKNHRWGKPNKVNLGRTFSEGTRKKVGIASARHWATLKGDDRKLSAATREKLRQAQTGRVKSPETIAKISASMKGKNSYKRSPETIENMRRAARERSSNPDIIHKMAESLKVSAKAIAARNDPERRRKHSAFMSALWKQRREVQWQSN